MSDVTSELPKTRSTQRRNFDYVLYFSIIFVLAIPFATVFWVLDVIRKQTLMLHGPLARAWGEAHRVTPIIFSV